MRGVFPTLLVAAGLAIMAPSDAAACSCATFVPPAAAVRDADAAFVGIVEEVDVPLFLREPFVNVVETPLAFLFFYDTPDVRTTFRVEQRYRGALGRRVVIDSGTGFGGSCSLGDVFTPGERWLVVAHERDDELHVNFCRSPLQQDQVPEAFAAALAALGPGKTEPHPRPRWVPRHDWWRWLGLGIPLALVALVVVGRRRRRRTSPTGVDGTESCQ